MFPDNKTFITLVNTVLILLIIFLLGKISFLILPFYGIFRTILMPIIISLFLYYALRPLVRRFYNKKIPKGLVILLTMTFLACIITLIIIYGGAVVTHQFQSSFSESLNKITSSQTFIAEKIRSVIPDFEFSQNTLGSINNIIKKLAGNMGTLFSGISNIGTQAILIPFILFYMLKDDKSFSQGFIKIIPQKYRAVVKNMMGDMDNILSIYISGQLLVGLVIGILMFIGYLIIGMPNALLMGFFAMITSVIPMIGAFLGIIPALLISLTINFSMIIKVIIVAVVVQQIEGNLITPNIVGNKLNIHPLAVIFIIIIGVSLFGFIGAFIGIPLYLILKIFIDGMYKIFTMRKFNIK